MHYGSIRPFPGSDSGFRLSFIPPGHFPVPTPASQFPALAHLLLRLRGARLQVVLEVDRLLDRRALRGIRLEKSQLVIVRKNQLAIGSYSNQKFRIKISTGID